MSETIKIFALKFKLYDIIKKQKRTNVRKGGVNMKIVEREINGNYYNFLEVSVEGVEITLGYLDRFNKVHLYTA